MKKDGKEELKKYIKDGELMCGNTKYIEDAGIIEDLIYIVRSNRERVIQHNLISPGFWQSDEDTSEFNELGEIAKEKRKVK